MSNGIRITGRWPPYPSNILAHVCCCLCRSEANEGLQFWCKIAINSLRQWHARWWERTKTSSCCCIVHPEWRAKNKRHNNTTQTFRGGRMLECWEVDACWWTQHKQMERRRETQQHKATCWNLATPVMMVHFEFNFQRDINKQTNKWTLEEEAK